MALLQGPKAIPPRPTDLHHGVAGHFQGPCAAVGKTRIAGGGELQPTLVLHVFEPVETGGNRWKHPSPNKKIPHKHHDVHEYHTKTKDFRAYSWGYFIGYNEML